MPIQYDLEKDGTVVVARATGVLTLGDFLSMQKTMRDDVALKDPHDTLLDVRDVAEIEISEQDLHAIAEGLSSGERKLGANRLAILAHDDQAVSLGQRYGTVKKDATETVIVFHGEDVARIWLGLQAITQAPSSSGPSTSLSSPG